MIDRVERRSGPLDAYAPDDLAQATEETVPLPVQAPPVGDDDGRA